MKPEELAGFDELLSARLESLGRTIRARTADQQGLEGLHQRDDGDTTYAFDVFANEELLNLFEKSGLPVRFSSEEGHDIDLAGDPQLLAVIDPLDGSDLLSRGYPLCSIAVSLVDMETSSPLLSRILDVFTGLQFSASGNRAYRNGRAVGPSAVRSIAEAFIVTYAATPVRMEGFCDAGAGLRRARLLLNYGGPLDIARVGAGQCDAMVEFVKGFRPRDYVPGLHIAQAAGATAAQLDGTVVPYALGRDERVRFVVSATRELCDAILDGLGAGSLPG
jgi:fructose-1,6-bisphosphatase/inositol monophosphatase family enzyme